MTQAQIYRHIETDHDKKRVIPKECEMARTSPPGGDERD